MIQPQTHIIILVQLSTTWIIDNIITLYHIFWGRRGPLLFKLILVISIKTPPFPVIVINTISSLVLLNPPYKAYLKTPHAGLFLTFHSFSYSSLWIIYLLIITIKCLSLYIYILAIYVFLIYFFILLTIYSISPYLPISISHTHTASICNNLQAIGESHFLWLYTKMWGRLDTVWLAPLLLWN